MIMYIIATIASGPKAAMLSGVNAETTEEKINAGRPTCFELSALSRTNTRVTHQTDYTNSLGKLRRKRSLLRYQVADSNTDHHLQRRRERYQVSYL
jgi:hypothetical protein